MAETMPSTQRSGRTPESLVVERSEHDVLAQAYQRLRPPEQEVLRLKDLEDWPYADIAARLGISLSAAKMRVQRARLALRDAYETLLTGDETHE